MKKILLLITLLIIPFTLSAEYKITQKDKVLINKVEKKIYKIIDSSYRYEKPITPDFIINRIEAIIEERKLSWRLKVVLETIIENIEKKYTVSLKIENTTWMEADFFAKQINVFWVKVFATKKVGDRKIMHAATIMAEYLDNNEDWAVDNKMLVNKLKEKKAALVMFYDENDSERFFENYDSEDFLEKYEIQDLLDFETRPNWFPHNKNSIEFDASIEEVLHLISSKWYSDLYNGLLWENDTSALSLYMDKARWDTFYDTPDEYPEDAWYTYYDETCDYNCQLTEYFYWAFTSYLWWQNSRTRLEEIEKEWKLNTKEKLIEKDNVYTIFENLDSFLPSKLPDGKYKKTD